MYRCEYSILYIINPFTFKNRMHNLLSKIYGSLGLLLKGVMKLHRERLFLSHLIRSMFTLMVTPKVK